MCFLVAFNLNSQDVQENSKTLTQEQYTQYFPIETQIAQFVPTTDFVCILPSNESDSALQNEVNRFYKKSFINYLPTVPHQTSRVIMDKQALNEDLSNINIYTFGTTKGNLWTASFLKKAKDFPIKITDDSIVAEKTYKGSNLILTALWYNPENFKHSVFLYIPQNLECAQNFKKINLFQYSIWESGEQISGLHYFALRENQWNFSNKQDTLLNFRDVNHAYTNPFTEIERYIFRYPKVEQLGNCKMDEKDISIDTIGISDINDEFGNISDMEWLLAIAGNYNIVAIGESHHLKFNNFIFRRILFAVNSFDYFPTLVLELPYSYTGYINYYLKIEDDVKAREFCDTVLSKIDKAGIPTFREIRSWNKLHRDKIISVGCSDLEQNLGLSINYILNSYFKKIVPESKLIVNNENIFIYLDSCQRYIDTAKKLNLTGDYPFQTPEYMASVFENLKSSVRIKLDAKNFYNHSERYKIMIRNVTDDRFLGNQVANDKCIFFGGSQHFRILNKGDDKDAINTEGYYLANSFKPTMGKMYAINLHTKAISIEDSIQRINPNLNFTQETDLIKLYKERKINLNEPVIMGFSFSEFDKYIYLLSHKYPNDAIRIKEFNVDSVINKLEGFSRFMEYIYSKTLQDYNANIIIPYSPVGN